MANNNYFSRNNLHKNNFELNEKKVLDFIIVNNKVTFLDIAKGLNIKPFRNKELTKILQNLLKLNKIECNQFEKYYALTFIQTIENNISITTKRFGFLDFENPTSEKCSAFLPAPSLINILDNDLVEANIYSYKDENNKIFYKANILKIIKQNHSSLVGKLKIINHKYYFDAIEPQNNAHFKILNLCKIPNNLANINDLLFKFKVIGYDDKSVLIDFDKIICSTNDENYVLKQIIESNDINEEFPFEVIEESNNIPDEVLEHEIKERTNLINLSTVTIDGLDTKDFDDAISCYKLNNGNYKLFIHIADVSYYVKENSAIDLEALHRGTSIYLPNKVIPMLPFKLSNGICSLNPNVIRACITLELEINQNGDNVSYQIYPSVIKSNYRLTYNDVNDLFENKNNTIPLDIKNNLFAARELAQILMKKKEEEGYIDFEIEEPKLIIEDSKIKDIIIKKEGESEKLIEAFMVRANETVATMMEKNKFPSIYRIHDKPSIEKLQELQELFKFSNINIFVPMDGSSKSFEMMVQKLKSINFDSYIKSFLLRTMQKAIYSAKNIGHFGLASKAYSHFTSPIRRYPDLLLHRLIRKYIFNKKYNESIYDTEYSKIDNIALQNSESEKNSMQVERDSVDYWKGKFFNQFINKTFQATAISIEKYGIFFNIEEYQTSVLVRFDNMNNNMLMISKYEASGNNITVKVGKKYNIIIDSIEFEKGKINAKLAL